MSAPRTGLDLCQGAPDRARNERRSPGAPKERFARSARPSGGEGKLEGGGAAKRSSPLERDKSGVDGTRTWGKSAKGPGKHADAPSRSMSPGANGRDSSPFTPIQAPPTRGDLEAAIASVTRAIAISSGQATVVLATERAALRAELGLVVETSTRIPAVRRPTSHPSRCYAPARELAAAAQGSSRRAPA
jgi:hypothetical protein